MFPFVANEWWQLVPASVHRNRSRDRSGGPGDDIVGSDPMSDLNGREGERQNGVFTSRWVLLISYYSH